jgi:hypothetical protein
MLNLISTNLVMQCMLTHLAGRSSPFCIMKRLFFYPAELCCILFATHQRYEDLFSRVMFSLSSFVDIGNISLFLLMAMLTPFGWQVTYDTLSAHTPFQQSNGLAVMICISARFLGRLGLRSTHHRFFCLGHQLFSFSLMVLAPCPHPTVH